MKQKFDKLNHGVRSVDSKDKISLALEIRDELLDMEEDFFERGAIDRAMVGWFRKRNKIFIGRRTCVITDGTPLSRDIIESFDWKCEEEFRDGRMSFLGLFKSDRKGVFTKHSLMYVKQTGWCLIANEDDKTMFCGTIKTTHEFKTLLKQIGI